MKKWLAVFLCLLFVFFSVSCLSAVAEEPSDELVPSTEVDPWVEVVSDVAGDHLTGHEDEVNGGLQTATGFVGKIKDFAEKIRDAFNSFIQKIDDLFDKIKAAFT